MFPGGELVMIDANASINWTFFYEKQSIGLMGCIAHVTINLHDLGLWGALICSHVPLLPLMTYVNGKYAWCVHHYPRSHVCMYQHDMCSQPSMGTAISGTGLVVSTRKLGNFREDPWWGEKRLYWMYFFINLAVAFMCWCAYDSSWATRCWLVSKLGMWLD